MDPEEYGVTQNHSTLKYNVITFSIKCLLVSPLHTIGGADKGRVSITTSS